MNLFYSYFIENLDFYRDEWKKLCCLPYAVSKHASVTSGNDLILFLIGSLFFG